MDKKRFDYALVLTEYLKQAAEEFVDIRDVARRSRLSRTYLEKVAQELKRAGWLESRRGSGGGYRLIKSSKNLSVGALINFYDPLRSFCPVLRTLKK